MGSSESKLDVAGHLHIELNNVTICAGQDIEGVVHLDLRKPFSTQNLRLRLEG